MRKITGYSWEVVYWVNVLKRALFPYVHLYCWNVNKGCSCSSWRNGSTVTNVSPSPPAQERPPKICRSDSLKAVRQHEAPGPVSPEAAADARPRPPAGRPPAARLTSCRWSGLNWELPDTRGRHRLPEPQTWPASELDLNILILRRRDPVKGRRQFDLFLLPTSFQRLILLENIITLAFHLLRK